MNIPIIYAGMAAITAVSFCMLNVRFYGPELKGDRYMYGLALLLGTFWPLGLPIYLYRYRNIVKSVLKGQDWASVRTKGTVGEILDMSEKEAAVFMKELDESLADEILVNTKDKDLN